MALDRGKGGTLRLRMPVHGSGRLSVGHMIARLHGHVRARVPSPQGVDIQLWLLVLTAMTLDIGLTIYGLERGLIERNPIAVFGIDTFGYAVLAFLKVPAIVFGVIGWVFLSPWERRLNLIGLGLPWIMAISLNSWLILTRA